MSVIHLGRLMVFVNDNYIGVSTNNIKLITNENIYEHHSFLTNTSMPIHVVTEQSADVDIQLKLDSSSVITYIREMHGQDINLKLTEKGISINAHGFIDHLLISSNGSQNLINFGFKIPNIQQNLTISEESNVSFVSTLPLTDDLKKSSIQPVLKRRIGDD